jgi:hypothetical protein
MYFFTKAVFCAIWAVLMAACYAVFIYTATVVSSTAMLILFIMLALLALTFLAIIVMEGKHNAEIYLSLKKKEK